MRLRSVSGQVGATLAVWTHAPGPLGHPLNLEGDLKLLP